MPRLHVIVHGSVQGVGYRWFAVHRARQHGIAGWIRNRPDGTVEAEAEGDLAALEALLADLRGGPAQAVVHRVDVDWNDDARGHNGFAVRD